MTEHSGIEDDAEKRDFAGREWPPERDYGGRVDWQAAYRRVEARVKELEGRETGCAYSDGGDPHRDCYSFAGHDGPHTWELEARASRYEEALREIARGTGTNPPDLTACKRLARAALQPDTDTQPRGPDPQTVDPELARLLEPPAQPEDDLRPVLPGPHIKTMPWANEHTDAARPERGTE